MFTSYLFYITFLIFIIVIILILKSTDVEKINAIGDFFKKIGFVKFLIKNKE